MDEQTVKKIIREELSSLISSDRYTFLKNIQILDGRNIQLGKTTGTKIGTSSDQLLGFYGATPVDRPASINDAGNVGAAYSQSEVQQIVTAVNTVILRLTELGLITSN